MSALQHHAALLAMTAGGGATWNPADKAATINLSDANLLAVGNSGSGGIVRATKPFTGRSYYEAHLVAAGSGGFGGSTAAIGMARSDHLLTAALGFSSGNPGWAIWGPSGGVRGNGSQVNSTSLAIGDRIGFYFDATTGSVWISRNGVQVQGNPETDTSPLFTGLAGTFYPAVCPWAFGIRIRGYFDPAGWLTTPSTFGPVG